MKIVSLFAGAGGLDLGFEKAGFNIVWANEYDKDIWETYEKNHKKTFLDRRSIMDIPSSEIPDCDGIIGGPPCQSWSAAGSKGGIRDKRGILFYEFMRILADKKPKFFLAENVSGILSKTHSEALKNIIGMFDKIGYTLSFKLVNVANYGIPQDRKRIFIIGYRKDLNIKFDFTQLKEEKKKITLKEAIEDLKDNVIPAKIGNYTNGDKCDIPNHEYMIGGFSSIFMSRNRVRKWDEVSFTIQAGGRHAPIHPQAPTMITIGKDKKEFVKGKEHLYRRFSVRECARIQTFPDNFIFCYNNIAAGYKMVGNAVPVKMASILAKKILNDINKLDDVRSVSELEVSSPINSNIIQEKIKELVKHSMKKADQTTNGKAFEYAILKEFYDRLKDITNVSIIENEPYRTAQKCFNFFGEIEQGYYKLSASFAINFLLDLEPRLSNGIEPNDILQLEIVSDQIGQSGDVRDVLAIRSLQKWEIGVSAKNNHRAVKHSRLSSSIDFGEKWLGIKCSSNYLKKITPIFDQLEELRKENTPIPTWASLGDYHSSVYVPILDAFKEELLELDKRNPGVVAQRLVEYLIGNKDFYKVIKQHSNIEIQAYNIHGTLNQSFQKIKPKFNIPILKLPTRLIEIVYAEASKTTLLVSLNEGWQISFRIHNASSKIEPSLKFDINLISSPHTLFTNHLSIKNG